MRKRKAPLLKIFWRRFCARVFQRVSMNLNTTVGQAACRLFLSIYSKHVGCVLCLLNRTIVTCASGERTCDCSRKCTWAKLKVVLQNRAMCRFSSIIPQQKHICFFWAML